MKKNMIMRIASVLLVAVLLSTCAIAGTFAKFTSEVTGEITAKVAKWDIEFKNGEDVVVEDFNFTLQDTMSRDENVNDGVIAPGTKGEYTLKITNNSDVKVEYDVVVTPGNDFPAGLTFSVSEATGNLGFAATETITITWNWKWSETEENTYAGADLVATVTVTVSQIN